MYTNLIHRVKKKCATWSALIYGVNFHIIRNYNTLHLHNTSRRHAQRVLFFTAIHNCNDFYHRFR